MFYYRQWIRSIWWTLFSNKTPPLELPLIFHTTSFPLEESAEISFPRTDYPFCIRLRSGGEILIFRIWWWSMKAVTFCPFVDVIPNMVSLVKSVELQITHSAKLQWNSSPSLWSNVSSRHLGGQSRIYLCQKLDHRVEKAAACDPKEAKLFVTSAHPRPRLD